MKLCIFEDQGYDGLYPMTLTRPAFELKCGHTQLWEKIVRKFPKTEVTFLCRDYVAEVFANRTGQGRVNDERALKGDGCLFVNGRWLFDNAGLSLDGPEEVGVCGEDVVYARVLGATLDRLASEGLSGLVGRLREALVVKEVEADLISYPWNLISKNPGAIEADFAALGRRGVHGKVHPQAALLGNESDVYIAEGVEVQPLVVLDATQGPIILEEGVTVFPNSRIEGPSCVGRDSQIVGTNLREGCAIGPVCRIGGEVEESIVHGYSNKYHTGFLGHSYLGEWVNLGALTTNSDLKNDYSAVDVYVRGKVMNSGDNKVGSFIGDHTKTGIGCLLITGTVIGVMSNVLPAGGMLPKFIPSFVWFSPDRVIAGSRIMRLGISTARTAMGRRKVEMTSADEEVLHKVYELTDEERKKVASRSKRKG